MSATALAASRPPTVTSHYWEVSINGHEQKVAAGGTIEYRPGSDIESITPEIVVTAGKGKHSYIYKTVGPPDAGETGTSEASVKGRRIAIDPTIRASVITRQEVTLPAERTSFLPGTYRFELYIYDTATHEMGVGVTHREKPTLVESIRLVAQ